MPEKLYRSHSLEKSSDGISGSLTIWEDSPVSPFDVGDTFSPVNGGPLLTVDKVSIKDNVVGELYGKPVRQWEVTIEGSNSVLDSSTHVKYNFNISADERSGTMEVVNTGDTPSISLDIGDVFSVPGIGSVYCYNVKGSDDYHDSGVHTWTVIYEGSDNQETLNPLPETKYNLAIEKDNDGDIHKSGSMSVISTGNSPALDISVGSTFSIPGIGTVTCSKITANDDYTEAGTHRWTMTYEGYTNPDNDDDQQDGSVANAKYSFSLEQEASGGISHSGSVEITTTGNAPSFTHQVGDTINLPGIGNVTCTKVSGSDSYSDTGKRKWIVIYEGSDKSSDETQQSSNVKYNLNIENNSDGFTIYSGSKEITSAGETPTLPVNIGGTFSLPIIGEVTCTRIQSSNEDANTWKVVIEGSRTGANNTSLPDTETVITYELNGSTVRTVAGEFVALKRSNTPILKKSITVYSLSASAVANPGSSYQGGIVTSENIVRETIKNNGIVTATYYKHTLEVEA